MTNQLVQHPYTGEDRRLFDLYIGKRNVAKIDIYCSRFEHTNGHVSVTQRRHAIRWYWYLIHSMGKGESVSPKETMTALRDMQVDITAFSGAMYEMGWGDLV